MENKSKTILTGLLIIGGMFTLLIFTFIVLSFSTLKSLISTDNIELEDANAEIAVIEITGTIMTSKKTIIKLLKAEKDKKIKAIIVRINSPGGAVAPTQEIYDEIRRIDKIKPIYASMGGVAASGGYYISSAARKIYASPGTLTGSIGVIMNFVDLSKLYSFTKMSFYTIKAGKYKDIGHPYRKLTKEEDKLMNELMKNVHQQFINHIVLTRGKLLKKNINDLAQGQVFSGEQAQKYGLIDKLGGLYKAGRDLHKDLNLTSKFKFKFIKEKNKFSILEIAQNLEDAITPLKWGSIANGTPMLVY